MDLEGKLFLDYPWDVSSIAVEPDGAIEIMPEPATASGWPAYTLSGKTFGRARITVTYDNGMVQAIQYYVTKPAHEAVSDLGNFLTTKDWYVAASDPFGRSPSVMTYDHELDQIVTQHKQAWVCGLGDDGGATWLAGAMKLFAQPDADQIAKYQQFVDGVIWGGLQYKDGAQQYGVKRTLFYYDPTAMPGYTATACSGSTPRPACSTAVPGITRTRSRPAAGTTIRTWPRCTGRCTAWRATTTAWCRTTTLAGT